MVYYVAQGTLWCVKLHRAIAAWSLVIGSLQIMSTSVHVFNVCSHPTDHVARAPGWPAGPGCMGALCSVCGRSAAGEPSETDGGTGSPGSDARDSGDGAVCVRSGKLPVGTRECDGEVKGRMLWGEVGAARGVAAGGFSGEAAAGGVGWGAAGGAGRGTAGSCIGGNP